MESTTEHAETTVQVTAAEIINRMLAEDGLGETISPGDVHSLGSSSRRIDRATYYLNAMKRFTVIVDVLPTGNPRVPYWTNVTVEDSRSFRRVQVRN